MMRIHCHLYRRNAASEFDLAHAEFPDLAQEFQRRPPHTNLMDLFNRD